MTSLRESLKPQASQSTGGREKPVKPRERVLAIMNRQSVNRLPVDLWLTQEILKLLMEQTETEDELECYQALGIDKILAVPIFYEGPLPDPVHVGGYVSLFGAQMKPVTAGTAVYQEYANRPLAGMNDPGELERYPFWPDPDAFDIARMADWVVNHSSEFALLGPWVSLFEIYCGLRGLEQALADLLENPDFLEAALNRIEEPQTELLRRLYKCVGDQVTFSFISDDMGSQDSLLLSPVLWAEHFGPRLRRLCSLGRSFGIYNFYHSDGAIGPLIPELIEAGIDVLNPIQHVCPGMDMKELKTCYGDRLVFHGGVDTQSVLPRGTTEQVRAEVRACLAALGRGRSGYICASCHNVQPDTPIDNVLALIDEVHRAG